MHLADDNRTIGRRITAVRWGIRLSALLVALLIIGVGWGGDRLLKRYLLTLQQDHAEGVALIENRVAIQRDHTLLQKQIEEVRKEYRDLLQRVPETASEGAFLRELSGLAEACDLTLRDFRPGRVSVHETHSEKQIHLRAEGRHANLCRFLAALQTTQRMNRVSHLTVGPANKQDLTSSIELHIEIAYAPQLPSTI